MNPAKSSTILYMDDDHDDLEMLEEALHSLDRSYTLQKATNGVEGLQQLDKMRQSGLLPCLIVLDLNMPKLNGRETVEKIKADTLLSTIPLVLFSTSNNPLDRAYFISENVEYIIKPVQYTIFLEVASRLLTICKNKKAG